MSGLNYNDLLTKLTRISPAPLPPQNENPKSRTSNLHEGFDKIYVHKNVT